VHTLVSAIADCISTRFWYLAWWWFSEPKHVAEFLILITNICCVIDWINYCVIAKHNGMAPIKKNHRFASIFYSWNQAFSIIGFLGCSQNTNPAWCWEKHEGWLIWPHFCFQSDIQVLWSSLHLSRLLALFSVIRGLAVAVVAWMWDLWSSHQTDFVKMVFKMNTEFCSHLCCTSSMILRHNPLSLSFGFQPLFLSADDLFPWFVYAIITLETAALYTPNKVAIWLQMLQWNTH